MDWLKKFYDRVALLILAILLLASSGFLFSKTKVFNETFAEVERNIPPDTQFKPAEVTLIEEAIAAVAKPVQWESHDGSLFVSRKYLVQNNVLVDPLEDGSITIHPPIPNQWLLDHQLDLLDSGVLSSDPDHDGFTVLDEYNGKSNPADPQSRPAYWTKLRLKQALIRRFRLKFAAYVDDSYQINTLDLRQPSQFLKIGETIHGTHFKLIRFEPKKFVNPSTGAEQDISELTVRNEENQQDVVLVLNKIADSPDSFALFVFLIDNSEFRVKKEQNFTLPVEPEVEYKLIDIKPTEAVITNLKTNERLTIPHLEAKR